ncbi:carboxylate--amine ligase [Lacticigenium naphthae]|uniref:carboxylate--amine ligase n=1 Tax=Lacticigenium naphthae TaxID=515351 RepID=UPI0003F7FF03|nr:carboxylate--amine ligase [Lacticigenium naphthae]
MAEKKFIPVIIGTDMNAYTMAASFHEEYNKKSILVGKSTLQFTRFSTLKREEYLDENFHDPTVFVDLLIDIAKKYHHETDHLILIGTNDFYVKMLVENQEKLRPYYLFNVVKKELMEQIYYKKNFYKLCAQHGIPTPKTYFYSSQNDDFFTEEVTFPVIIKPSNGIAYYHNPFEGMEKVYKVNSYEEINEIISKIKNSGYTDELIIQDFIPGDDTFMWDSVFYANTNGVPQLITLAQVVLQEHTITAIGNYTALIVRHDRPLMDKLANFLKTLGYTGFANFDIKFDERDGKYKVFEVNLRQGRSSYYTTQCGKNMAKMIVDDVLYHKEKELHYLKADFLFTVVPKIVLKKFVQNVEIRNEVNELLKEGKWGNPLFYKPDKNLKRTLFLFLRQVNYYKKYSQNQW